MNKGVTVEDFVESIIKSTCINCVHYEKYMRVCGGEVLPIEQAIFRNLEGRGLCEKVKEIDRILKSNP